jgi:hypothetical protein
MAPTFDLAEAFGRDWANLAEPARARFRRAKDRFVEDLKRDRQPRPGLRVKRVQGTEDVWELTWAPDGRATFQYGAELRPGEPHIVWRRIGDHSVLDRP